MLLFYDTETTGLANYRLPANHSSQPYLVQLAFKLVTPDQRVIMSMNAIINNGVDIPSGASNVHGITTEMAEAFGATPHQALSVFAFAHSRASTIVAHNIGFDKRIMETAFSRVDGVAQPESKPEHCTMEEATPIVNIPPTRKMIAAGYNKPKSAQLGECIEHFFGEPLSGAHDAMVDVEGCERLYFHLRELEKSQ